MKQELAKLLNPSVFEQDEPVGIAAVKKDLLPGPIEEHWWRYISERLWSRLLSLGSAYQLHFYKVVEPVIDTVLLPEQCESFVEEIEFLQGVINDQALQKALNILSQELSKVVNRQHMRLVISPP